MIMSKNIIFILIYNRYKLLEIIYVTKNQKVRDHWEDQDVSEWTILKLILER
jgi:hypothetical protein